MINLFFIYLLLPVLIGIALSFGLELILKPTAGMVWLRRTPALGVHIGIWLIAYGLELALFRRPIFAVVNVLALQTVIVLVSNAKFAALREPFVYSDFEYFLDAVRHPRLYLPFFGRTRATIAGGGYGLALWGGLALEESLTSVTGLWALSFGGWVEEHAISIPSMMLVFWGLTASFVLLGALLVTWAGQYLKKFKVTFDASEDLRELGLLAALWCYRWHERRGYVAPIDASPFNILGDKYSPGSVVEPNLLPDIVAVQSESFFDPRRMFSSIRTEVLCGFDALKDRSIAHGRLKVAAWGANTVRTEFAMLSGLPPESLGVHRFNPYRRLARSCVPTLASYLRGLGYRTICVHPYPASFYTRNIVYPKMGFDTFLDISQFLGAERAGPYVSDAAVAKLVERELTDVERTEQPLFIFVITMENHGPLHWETVDKYDKERLFTEPPIDSCNDLVAYVRHLANADSMFSSLANTLTAMSRPSALCIYGDHVPIMPKVYELMGEPDGKTDYLIWRPDGPSDASATGISTEKGAAESTIAVNDLGVALLNAVGLRRP